MNFFERIGDFLKLVCFKFSKSLLFGGLCILLVVVVIFSSLLPRGVDDYYTIPTNATAQKFIKWVDFSVSYAALKQAVDYDINSHDKTISFDFISLLAIAACKNGGKFPEKRCDIIDKTVERIKSGETIESITANMEYYSYYYEAYSAVLSGLLGETDNGYKIKMYSPIASGFSYSHSDDFGNGRTYGFNRKHLGNDLMGSVGTPIVAVEGGIVEMLGWNRYGGWRIGIRSYDTKRYYYYAHLRSGHPFVEGLKEGMEVKAGDVIGYLGMTGYSDTEDHNGMKVPHLHFGMQLIFDESQKDGNSEIWIDVYNIVRLLQGSRSKVRKNADSGEWERIT